MLEERDIRWHPIGQSLFMRGLHVFFQIPLPRLETYHAPRDAVVSMHFPIIQPRQLFYVHVCDSSAVCKIQNIPYFGVDMHPKLGETGEDPLERISTRPLCPTSDPNDS
ncbi:hypothetical protein TNCV_1032341 [Trichonephila clavipes]|nr:hypothetical protein TNCV_1032341 [Trichonephila clavipes]